MRKQEAEKLFIWAILEYNKVRADATKTEDKMIDESFANWYGEWNDLLDILRKDY